MSTETSTNKESDDFIQKNREHSQFLRNQYKEWYLREQIRQKLVDGTIVCVKTEFGNLILISGEEA